jgi:periplasmic protein TonB
VIAEVVIGTDGNVADAKVVRSIPMLDNSALQEVNGWHFAPTLLNGKPIPVRMYFGVDFTLPSAALSPDSTPR